VRKNTLRTFHIGSCCSCCCFSSTYIFIPYALLTFVVCQFGQRLKCFGIVVKQQFKFYCQLQPHTTDAITSLHTDRKTHRHTHIPFAVSLCAVNCQRDIKLRVTFYFRCYVIHFRFVGWFTFTVNLVLSASNKLFADLFFTYALSPLSSFS